MKDRIPDRKIKDNVSNFNSGNAECYNNIVRLLSPYIYNYPRIVYRQDLDTCGEFYEYMLKRLKEVLAGYRESEARFTSWFTVVLRNRYLNFVRSRSFAGENSGWENISLDNCREEHQSLYSILSDGKDYGGRRFERYEELVDRIVRNLREKHRIFFHLYFIEALRPEDIGFLSIALDMNVRETLTGITAIRESVMKKYKLKHSLSLKLGDIYRKLLQTRDEEKIKELKKKQEKVLEEYRRVKLNPSYESIYRFMGCSLGTVSTGISRMKNEVRKVLEEYFNGKMQF